MIKIIYYKIFQILSNKQSNNSKRKLITLLSMVQKIYDDDQSTVIYGDYCDYKRIHKYN